MTATTRTSGNVSSRCRYKTGARRCASTAKVSVLARAPGRFAGRSGMCARGPQASRRQGRSPRDDRTRIWMAFPLNGWPWKFTHAARTAHRCVEVIGEHMRKPRPNAYNPAQALFLISNDRSGSPLSCPSCSGSIERDPRQIPPPPYTHVTLRCKSCGRSAHYVAGAA